MTTYYPILRNSSAEIQALSEFYKYSNSETQNFIPIIELKHKFFSGDSDPKFNTTGTYLKKKLGSNKLILQFSSTFPNEDERSIAEEWEHETHGNVIQTIQYYLEKSEINYFPCVLYNDPDWILKSISRKKFSTIFVRIKCNNFSTQDEKLTLLGIIKRMETQFPHSELTFILDFYDILPGEKRLINLSNLFIEEGLNVVFCGTACPENADKAEAGKFSFANYRDEFNLFKKVHTVIPELNFSDYTVRLKPEPPTKKKKQMNPDNTYFKIFYSTEESYMISKSDQRKNIRKEGMKDSSDMCSMIVNSPYYTSKSFSWGDRFIYECANRNDFYQINDHSKPIAIGINHHLHLTQTQL